MDKNQLKLFSKVLSNGGYDCEMYASTFNFIKNKACVSEEEFLKIPFSYKTDIRNHDLVSRSNYLSPTFGIFGSSGTTGNKTYYKFSFNDRNVFDKIATKILKRTGVNRSDLGIICAPVLDGVMAHTMMWQYTALGAGYVNCPEPSPDNFLKVMESAHPTVVSGLPSALDFSLAPDFSLPKFTSIRLFLSGGNFFSNNKRKRLEDKWRMNWFDLLGVSEIFGPIMGECFEKHGLHYDQELLLVEIIDPTTMLPIEESEKIGMLVITPLWNKGSPLVRYWTDDFAYRITKPCKCGENGEKIYICGRKNDYLKVEDRYIFPREIENIVFAHAKSNNVFVDLADDNKIIVYTDGLSQEGQKAVRDLFGCPLYFRSDYSFSNMKNHKPSLFSVNIKQNFNE